MSVFPSSVVAALAAYFKRWRWALIVNGGLLAGVGLALGMAGINLPELSSTRGVWLVLLGLAMVVHGAVLGWHDDADARAAHCAPTSARPIGRIVAALAAALLLGAAVGQWWVSKIEPRQKEPYSSAEMAREALPITEALAMVGGSLLICEPGQGWRIESLLNSREILTFKSSESIAPLLNVACPTTRTRYSVARDGSAYAGRNVYSFETYMVDNEDDWQKRSEGNRRLAIAAIAKQVQERRQEILLKLARP